MQRLPAITTIAHWYLRNLLPENACVVDATCGNGHDSALLAELVAPNGFLLSVDIQPEAIQATSQRLSHIGVSPNRWTCLLADHRDLPLILPPPLQSGLDAAVFNLGYLPGGPKTITTARSSMDALKRTLPLLKPSGFLVVTSYPGFEEGLAEHNGVAEWLHQKASNGHDLHHLVSEGRQQRPPELWILSNGKSTTHPLA
jgi:SAM-dependent methyltransferase